LYNLPGRVVLALNKLMANPSRGGDAKLPVWDRQRSEIAELPTRANFSRVVDTEISAALVPEFLT
jgi:hypothetical protein